MTTQRRREEEKKDNGGGLLLIGGLLGGAALSALLWKKSRASANGGGGGLPGDIGGSRWPGGALSEASGVVLAVPNDCQPGSAATSWAIAQLPEFQDASGGRYVYDRNRNPVVEAAGGSILISWRVRNTGTKAMPIQIGFCAISGNLEACTYGGRIIDPGEETWVQHSHTVAGIHISGSLPQIVFISDIDCDGNTIGGSVLTAKSPMTPPGVLPVLPTKLLSSTDIDPSVITYAFPIGARVVLHIPEGDYPGVVTRHEGSHPVNGQPLYGLTLDLNGMNASGIWESMLTAEGSTAARMFSRTRAATRVGRRLVRQPRPLRL